MLRRTLLVATEKDLADSKVDIKVYLCTLDSIPNLSKLQIEIFAVEEAALVYRSDFLSSCDEIGKQVLMERFSLTDEAIRVANTQLATELVDDGRNRGLVLNISETSFPHTINVMLLEPCSHIFWSYSYRDDKLSRIEKRADKQAFAMHLNSSLEDQLLRDLDNP